MFFFSLIFSILISCYAQEISIPALTSPIMDEANLLSSTEEEVLAKICYNIHTSQGPQVTIFTVNDLQGYTIEDFSIKVAEKWKLGSEKKDDGILILLSKSEKKIRIEVGNGIEGEITDYDANKMIRNIMIPNFRRGDFFTAFKDVLEEISNRFNLNLENSDTKLYRKTSRIQGQKFQVLFPIIIVVLILAQIFLSKNVFARGIFSGMTISGMSYLFIPGIGLGIFIIFLLGTVLGLIGINNILYMLLSSRGGGGGGYSGGSGWSGGGGGFSGGGSSGDW